VLESVLRQGNPFFNRNRIGGLEYDTAYWPLRAADGTVVGMGFIGRDRDHVRTAYLHLFVTIAGSIAAVGAVILVLSLWMARSIGAHVHGLVESLLSGSDEVTGAAAQVSTASQHLAAASSRQASELEEASASLEEISSMVRSNTDNAEQSTGFAQQARTAAEHGVQEMEAMGNAMQAIKASSDDIAKIIKTIDEIAFQTQHPSPSTPPSRPARAGEAGAGSLLWPRRCAASPHAAAAADPRRRRSRSPPPSPVPPKAWKAVPRSAPASARSSSWSRKVDELSAEVCSASREQSQGLALLTNPSARWTRSRRTTPPAPRRRPPPPPSSAPRRRRSATPRAACCSLSNGGAAERDRGKPGKKRRPALAHRSAANRHCDEVDRRAAPFRPAHLQCCPDNQIDSGNGTATR
jgi:hypothetical protein